MNEILTPEIVNKLITCVSLLLALHCIATLIKNIWGIKDNCENCHKQKHLSYKYIVVFLVFLLVILFSHKFYNRDDVFNFMSFASAIISIILAILTIIYSYYTNGTTSSSVEKLGEATIKIEETLIKVNEATQTYKASADKLSENIVSILDSINHVEEQTSRILIEQMENNQKETISGQSFNMKDKDVSRFVESASQLGTMALYAASFANERNNNFNLNVIWDSNQVWYSAGFIVSTSCFNLLEAEFNFQDDNLYMSVSEFSKKLKAEVNSKVEKKIKDKEDFYITSKKSIDAFFENYK